MSNINRDYLIILDVKSGEVDSPNIYYFNTDKNTSNLYVQMVLRETTVEATPIENAAEYSIKANILKPNMVGKEVEGTLVNLEKAIYEFKLPADCTDFSGNAKIEFEVYAGDKIATSFATKFKVHGSVLTEQNKYIEDSSDYPILKELMAEVKVINETAHELDTTIRTLQSDMIEANNEMKANEVTRQANETTRVANEEARVEAEITRVNQEATRVEAETTREEQEATRVTNENDRIYKEDRRESQERDRTSNEYDRQNAEQSREYAEIDRAANEEVRQTNESNRVAAEEIRKANEQARIVEHEAMRTEHDQTMTAVNEVKAENAVLMENDKKIADRMTQVEISDKRQYVIMEGLMNSAGDGYLKIEDTGNDTTLYNSVEGFIDVKNITGNTMVNSIKNPDDELTLNGDINTSGQSVTLTTAVDNGQVDVLAEGNTMVNVCDQQEAVAITKSYTVETGNHISLEGDYDGKCRPVVTGNTLVNIIDSFGSVINAEADFSTGSYKCTANGTARHLYYKVIPKTSTTYTAIAYVNKNTINDKFSLIGLDVTENNSPITIPTGFTGLFVSKFTTKADNLDNIWETDLWKENTEGEIEIKGFMILEGDYTNKPIPDYFTGMQSSFEDNVVTQEMVDSGKELAENLGKYKVEYKVTGKNKIPYVEQGDISSTGTNVSSTTVSRTGFIPVKYGTTYTFSQNALTSSDWHKVFHYDKNKKFITMGYSFQPNSGDGYIRIVMQNKNQDNWTPQYEEGSTATVYEPYKESIKTYYLNSPLLEGDTIEESNGNVYHIHRYGKVVLDGSKDWQVNEQTGDNGNYYIVYYVPSNIYNGSRWGRIYSDKYPMYTPESGMWRTNEWIGLHGWGLGINLNILKSKLSTVNIPGVKTYLSSNPTTVVYQLASPTYELISQNDTILTDSYVSGHLDFDTAVPVERVNFRDKEFVLRYLYPSTEYIVQFESDNIGKIDWVLFHSGNSSLDINIVKGLNKFNLITPATLGESKMYIAGIGFSASNIVVTEATDKDFGYFSGMKSVGELEGNTIEIVSANGTDSTAEGYLSNTKQILLNEPLRAVGDTKDRFVQIDGKWYVERNVGSELITTGNQYNHVASPDCSIVSYSFNNVIKYTAEVKSNSLPYKAYGYQKNTKCISSYGDSNNGFAVYISIPNTELISPDRTGVIDWLTKNPTTVIYPLASPTYEPVEISPTLNTYTDVTHITNNSTIPMNMPIVNSGYELIVKPSTKYTVVGIDNGRIGDSTIVNGTITTPATITDNFLRPYGTGKTSKVMLLEGEPANIPGYFKGIKSVFEDKVTEDGKYACKVRVYNDLGEETVQTLYLDEPLYNANNITIYNDKLGYWKNWDKIVLDGSEDENWNSYVTASNSYGIDINNIKPGSITICDKVKSFMHSNGKSIVIDIGIEKIDISIPLYLRVPKFRQWLSENPITVVYQLAEPVFVPLIDNCPNFVIGSWDNCSIHFDSIIPLKDTRYRYTGNVPSVVAMSDDVATNSAVSDEQDNLIIDLATQVAVLEMMTL